ncbi:hypothetical protein [Pseudonocardia broussonetiae]|uniref:Uncharacterized protein n=1 Tax=Pseudonocardia broussonetiae TaxID=2736640 RepID=A0A6M6JJ14_9PSEU|nr:hypothetical protein [Pseudonocardia broussonetiae]QJY46642.1 hypothetical protein HOP40_13130 [Pseudonocardia broussonetiae]
MTDTETARLRAELAEVRADAEVRLLILAMTPYLPSNGHRLPPLFERRRVSIPAPRVTPEGARHARPARAARRAR